MAAVEQSPAVQQRIPRSRSARLADQAATAALYVTHPERRLSLREPSVEPDPTTALKETGSRPGFSHASALAALEHARKREIGARQAASTSHTADRRDTSSPSYEGYSYQAAICAIKERSAASGVYGNRRRAESAPSEAARASIEASVKGVGDPFENLDKYMNASRIQNFHLNPKLFTATPPVAPELEEHRRRSILEAASMSMAKDMYRAIETKEGGSAGLHGLPAHTRPQQSVSKPEPAIFNLQNIAEKRAAEKLASLEDETVVYRRYYGIEPQSTRPSFALRRRRGSDDTEMHDIERSKEIRTQMSALQSKLTAVDEKREKDRTTLLELAKKNVDAAIQDMEMRLYAETGRTPVNMQRDLEERALDRSQKDIQGIDTQYTMGERVNIGAQKYVDMADVEHLARSRLQPTFDEIDDLAQTQKAREVEERLDEEHRQHLLDLEREREADMRMEERRHKELLKQELKYREEKVWPWKRKSRQAQNIESSADKHATQGHTQQQVSGRTAATSEAAQTRTAEEGQEAAPGAMDQMESVPRQDSKLKSWFNRLGRHSSASPAKDVNGTQGEEQRVNEPTAGDTSGVTEGAEGGEGGERTQELEAGRSEVAGGEAVETHEPKTEREQIAEPIAGVAHAPEGNSRAVPLRSHPVTAMDLSHPVQGNSSDKDVDRLSGMTPSEYLATQQDSKEIVERSSSMKQQRSRDAAVHELRPPSNEREVLRETAAEHSLAAPPPIGDGGKRTSNSSARESRFSEDL